MPLKEYVDSRFSTPDEMARFKSVQWIIGYVLGMVLLASSNLLVTTCCDDNLYMASVSEVETCSSRSLPVQAIGPVYASIFDAKGETYFTRAVPWPSFTAMDPGSTFS